jgi:hypothetical protein
MSTKPRVSMIVSLSIFLLLAGSLIPAQAGPAFIIDEYGPWYYQPASDQPWVIRNPTVGTDPSGGTDSNGVPLSVLYFTWAPSYPSHLEHNVFVNEYDSTVLSDIIRFWSAGAAPLYVIFYSGDTGGGAPADSGFPQNISPLATINEKLDGSFAFTTTTGVKFIGYSDSHAPNPMPEPATMLLLGTGLIGLAGLRRRIGR